MKAVAVTPGAANSVRLVEMPEPTLNSASGRDVKVKVLRVGACGTDREINNAEYGVAPEGYEYLVLGHENFGQVVEVGKDVTEVQPGDYVVATVRRPGTSIYDQIGTQDMTTDDEYFERGISRVHGYMTEFYIERADYMVRVPAALREVAVLLEPLSIVEKGLWQADEIQRRLKIWQPKTAAVLGTGSVGLLTVMALRIRGYEVHGFGRQKKPYLNAELCEAIGATYDSTDDLPFVESVKKYGEYDLILECTGYSPLVFDAMQTLNQNGILILTSVTGGHKTINDVPADKINQSFVLGNRVMVGTVNANRGHFAMGVQDLTMCEALYPGWLGRMLTHRVEGLDNFDQLFDTLNNASKVNAIKAYFQVAPF